MIEQLKYRKVMYLLVFVLLMVSIIGLYTELYALQISQMLSKQKGVAEVMQNWHTGARLFARTTTAVQNDPQINTLSGCLLTQNPEVALTFPPYCAATLSHNMSNFLPVGYQSRYKWYSIVYSPGGIFGAQRFIVTYALPSETGNTNSNITYPRIGFSPSEILRQIRNSNLPKTTYGMVRSGRIELLDAPYTTGTNNVPQPIPVPETSGVRSLSEGSVALISPLW